MNRGIFMYQQKYNPDILSCLASLSNDEVFTTPKVAKEILDSLPQEIWSDSTITFLDPCSKTGIFLREITTRLLDGLKDEIPDLQERINHILTKQVFGMGITELTTLMTRRTLYCSKTANGQYSICNGFDNESGNIYFERTNHTWDKNKKAESKCIHCGALKKKYDRGEHLETHAYEFIHKDVKELFQDMKFDVIIGNPPYHLDTGGAGRQAKPIYNLFVEQAKKLNPRYLVMIIPSRWFSGGMGLDGFRESMMNDKHITRIVDYANAKDCFPQNSISGGVCYFLREKDRKGMCKFTNINNGVEDTVHRPLNEFPVIVRYNKGVSIIHKIQKLNETPFSSIISPLMPYGLSTNVRGSAERTSEDDLILHASDGTSYIESTSITKGLDTINKYKILISKTSAEHAGEPGKDGMFRVITSSIKVIGPGEICTHSYFIIGSYDNEEEAYNTLSYLKTGFVRFLLLLSMSSINLSKLVFSFVPMQDFSKPWTDEELFLKYALTDEEIKFIESMIKPMASVVAKKTEVEIVGEQA